MAGFDGDHAVNHPLGMVIDWESGLRTEGLLLGSRVAVGCTRAVTLGTRRFREEVIFFEKARSADFAVPVWTIENAFLPGC